MKKTVEIRLFLNILLIDGRNRIGIRIRIQEAQRLADPEHWTGQDTYELADQYDGENVHEDLPEVDL